MAMKIVSANIGKKQKINWRGQELFTTQMKM
jgi:hypothetical protein